MKLTTKIHREVQLSLFSSMISALELPNGFKWRFVMKGVHGKCASLLPVCSVQGHALKVLFLADLGLQALELLC